MSVSTMKKLTVLSYRADADAIVRRLMSLRCVEIRNTDSGDGSFLSEHLDKSREKSEAEDKLRAIRESLPVLTRYTSRKKKFGRNVHRVNREEFISSGRRDEAWKTVTKTLELRDRIEDIRSGITRAQNRAEALLPWLDYDAPLNEDGSRETGLLLGAFPSGSDPDAVTEEIAGFCAASEIVSADENGVYTAILYHKDDEEELNRSLAARGFVRAVFKDTDCTARLAYEETQATLASMEEELAAKEELLRALADQLNDVEILCDFIETDATAARQLQKLAVTKNCAYLEGWVPVFTQDEVVKALSKYECAYELSDPEEGEEPPVLLRNNRFSMTFEWVIGMYAYPKYGAFDPTFIMSIFYFLLFGLMFADVGYGLILILGCFGAVRFLHPKTGLKRMLLMFGYCGVSSVIMGLIFGGWFGDLPTAIMENMLHVSTDSSVGHFFGSGLWFNPLDDPMTFLILSLGIGFVHLVTGMIINFVVLCKRGRAGEAICTIAPYWVLFGGLVMLVLGLLGDSMKAVSDIGTYVAIAGAALILLLNGYGQKNPFKRLTKGLGGLYGLISYASDLLSYSRILALGLVAGVIAKVINLITMLGSSPVGFVLMVVILLAGHLLNLAINVLGTFVHTSRLQYIEFFGKFYEDGGTPFVPAAESDQFTEFVGPGEC